MDDCDEPTTCTDQLKVKEMDDCDPITDRLKVKEMDDINDPTTYTDQLKVKEMDDINDPTTYTDRLKVKKMDDIDHPTTYTDRLKVTDTFSLSEPADSSSASNRNGQAPTEEQQFESDLNTILKKIFLSDDASILSLSPKTQKSISARRVKCKICSIKYHPSFVDLHKKHYCGKPLKELGLMRVGPGNVFQCVHCERKRNNDKSVTSIFYENYNLALFHARYLCSLDTEDKANFRCVYCQSNVLKKEFLLHARQRHGKNTDNVLSFVEVLLAAIMKP